MLQIHGVSLLLRKMATRSSPGYAALISSHHQLSGIAQPWGEFGSISLRWRVLIFLTCGPLESGGVFCRNSWFLAREQVFDTEYLKASDFPNGVSSTSALAAPMSALWPIASALPPKGDIRVAVADFRS